MKKRNHADRQDVPPVRDPYCKCTCDLSDDSDNGEDGRHEKSMRVYHENGETTSHLPECSAYCSSRQEPSTIVDLTFDPYEYCKCDSDEDFDDMIARERVICMVHGENEPLCHFKYCNYAAAEQMGRMRKHDRKLARRNALLEHNRTIANKPKPHSKKRNHTAPRTVVPIPNPYDKCDCILDDHFDDMVSQGKVVHIFDEVGNSRKHLHSCSVHGVAARTKASKKRRPALLEKADNSYVKPEEPEKASPAIQYDPRTIASCVLRALGIDPYSVAVKAQNKKRRRNETSNIVDLEN